MKKKYLLGAVTAATFACANISLAQCVQNAGTLTGANTGNAINFDTCTATDQLATNCSGLNPIGSAVDAIWQVQIGPGANSGSFNLTTSNAAYDMYVGLMSGTCSAASPCPLEADSNGAGGAETLGPIDSLADGTYFMIVTTFGAGCGPVSFTVPPLPVTLQGFTVE